MTKSATTGQLMIGGRAAAIVLALWIAYTAIYTAPLSDAGHAAFEFVPGLLAVAVLWWAGYRNGNWYLRAGLGWGWQVQRERTIVWAMGEHVIFLTIMSLFGM